MTGNSFLPFCNSGPRFTAPDWVFPGCPALYVCVCMCVCTKERHKQVGVVSLWCFCMHQHVRFGARKRLFWFIRAESSFLWHIHVHLSLYDVDPNTNNPPPPRHSCGVCPLTVSMQHFERPLLVWTAPLMLLSVVSHSFLHPGEGEKKWKKERGVGGLWK